MLEILQKIFWQTTCSECWIKGSRTLRKLYTFIFMYFIIWLEFISSSTLIDLQTRKRIHKKGLQARSEQIWADLPGSGQLRPQRTGRARSTARQVGPTSQPDLKAESVRATPSVRMRRDQRLSLIFNLWPRESRVETLGLAGMLGGKPRKIL
jgi:hypothetical protein